MDFTVLLDAPAAPTSRIQIARLGSVTDKRYGEFDITANQVENWKRNLSKLPGQRALIDFEHRSERSPRDSEAAGWITGIDLDGDKVMADAEWTDKGTDAIQSKRYLFLSPAYGKYANEHGELFEDTLVSTALTNKPVLGSLPMLSLASEERVSEAVDSELERLVDLKTLDVSTKERKQAASDGNALPDGSYPIRNAKELHSAAVLAASGHGDVAGAKKLIRKRAAALGVSLSHLPGFADDNKTPKQMSADGSDSPPPMNDLLTLLDLPEDADEAKILEAVTELKEQADKEPEVTEPKTLAIQAGEAGKVLLDADAFTTLSANAAAGAAAAAELKKTKFESAFTLALSEGKAIEAQRERFEKFYLLDAESTLAMLSEAEPIINVKPTRGWDNGNQTGAEKSLDQIVREKATELSVSYDAAYLKVLDDVQAGKVEVAL